MKQTTRTTGTRAVQFSCSALEEVYVVCSFRLRSEKYRHQMYYDESDYAAIKNDVRRGLRSVRRGELESSAEAEEDEEVEEVFTARGVERLLLPKDERDALKAGRKRTIQAVLETQRRQKEMTSSVGSSTVVVDEAAAIIAEASVRESLHHREKALANGLSDERAAVAAVTDENAPPATTSAPASSSFGPRHQRRSSHDVVAISAEGAGLTPSASATTTPPPPSFDAETRKVRTFSSSDSIIDLQQQKCFSLAHPADFYYSGGGGVKTAKAFAYRSAAPNVAHLVHVSNMLARSL